MSLTLIAAVETEDDLAHEVDLLRVKYNLSEIHRNLVYHKLKDPTAMDQDVMKRAGYGVRAIRAHRRQMMNSPGVINALRDYREAHLPHVVASPERVVEEWGHIAFANVKDYYQEDKAGNISFKSLADISDEQARAIAEITSSKSPNGAMSHKVKFHDKKAALDSLAKHFGVLDSGTNVTLTIETIQSELYSND